MATAKNTIDLAEISPRYAAATARAAQLAERSNAVNERLASIGSDFVRAQTAAFDHHAQGRALLDADDLDVALAEPASSELADLDAERAKLNADRERIEQARRQCDAKVSEARAEASAIVCRDALPLYREMVGRLVDAVLAAHAIQAEIDGFTNRLDLANVAWESQLHPAPFFPLRGVGHHDQLPVWLRECRDRKSVV